MRVIKMRLIKFFVVLVLVFLETTVASRNTRAQNRAARVGVLMLKGPITVGTSEYFERAFERAKHDDWAAILVRVDTPGGFLEATREIVQLFLNSERPVVVWVEPEGARAASAGSMITMAAHYAAMAPSTAIGAATPVTSTGADVTGDMKHKIMADTLSFVTNIAQKRGRNVEWAQASVTKADSLTAQMALEKHVIDGIHATRDDLWAGVLKKFPSLPSQPEFVDYPPSAKERFLSFISDPNIAYGLMALGALGIYIEMTHPGTVVPGAVGAISLALGAMTMRIIPIRPGAIGLLILGLILIGIEVLTPLPTFGVAGVGGAACLFLSGLFLMDADQTNLTLSATLWIPLFVLVVGFMFFIGYMATRALRSNYKQGYQALLDKEVSIVSLVSQEEAKVRVQGELWNVRWRDSQPSRPFKMGERVKIVAQEGLLLYVIEAEQATSS
jgi:membrane-bound serine protease (ClpP class)